MMWLESERIRDDGIGFHVVHNNYRFTGMYRDYVDDPSDKLVYLFWVLGTFGVFNSEVLLKLPTHMKQSQHFFSDLTFYLFIMHKVSSSHPILFFSFAYLGSCLQRAF